MAEKKPVGCIVETEEHMLCALTPSLCPETSRTQVLSSFLNQSCNNLLPTPTVSDQEKVHAQLGSVLEASGCLWLEVDWPDPVNRDLPTARSLNEGGYLHEPPLQSGEVEQPEVVGHPIGRQSTKHIHCLAGGDVGGRVKVPRVGPWASVLRPCQHLGPAALGNGVSAERQRPLWPGWERQGQPLE